MTRTTQELREAGTRSMRRGRMFREGARLAALTLLGLGLGLGDGGFTTAAEYAGAHPARDGGLLMATAGEAAESVRTIDRARLVPERTLKAVGVVGERRGCAGTSSTAEPNKVLLLRAIHLGSVCGMERPCSATKLYVSDNNRKSAFSIFSPRDRATGGRHVDRKSMQ